MRLAYSASVWDVATESWTVTQRPPSDLGGESDMSVVCRGDARDNGQTETNTCVQPRN